MKLSKAKEGHTAHDPVCKAMAFLTYLGAIVGLIATKMSVTVTDFDKFHDKFVLENIGTGGIVTAYVCALVLIAYQGNVYWPLWNKKDRHNADERQRAVRQRIFEYSYRALIIIVLAAQFFIGFREPRMAKIAPWLLVLAVMALPSLVAAWQKDS